MSLSVQLKADNHEGRDLAEEDVAFSIDLSESMAFTAGVTQQDIGFPKMAVLSGSGATFRDVLPL